mgnify:CR=1 FL=1
MKVEIDEEIIDAETDRMYKNFIEKLKMQGVTEELYFAYSGAKKEDIILIAGKGKDMYMAIKDKYIPYSDYEVVEKYINSVNKSK